MTKMTKMPLKTMLAHKSYLGLGTRERELVMVHVAVEDLN